PSHGSSCTTRATCGRPGGSSFATRATCGRPGGSSFATCDHPGGQRAVANAAQRIDRAVPGGVAWPGKRAAISGPALQPRKQTQSGDREREVQSEQPDSGQSELARSALSSLQGLQVPVARQGLVGKPLQPYHPDRRWILLLGRRILVPCLGLQSRLLVLSVRWADLRVQRLAA